MNQDIKVGDVFFIKVSKIGITAIVTKNDKSFIN